MPTLVEITQALDDASEALRDAVVAAVEAQIDYLEAKGVHDDAQQALFDARASHAAVLAQIDSLS